MITGMSRVDWRTRSSRRASKPVIFGMTTSMRMRSGRSRSALLTPSRPSLAVIRSYGPFLRIICSMKSEVLESSTSRIFLRITGRSRRAGPSCGFSHQRADDRFQLRHALRLLHEHVHAEAAGGARDRVRWMPGHEDDARAPPAAPGLDHDRQPLRPFARGELEVGDDGVVAGSGQQILRFAHACRAIHVVTAALQIVLHALPDSRVVVDDEQSVLHGGYPRAPRVPPPESGRRPRRCDLKRLTPRLRAAPLSMLRSQRRRVGGRTVQFLEGRSRNRTAAGAFGSGREAFDSLVERALGDAEAAGRVLDVAVHGAQRGLDVTLLELFQRGGGAGLGG